MFMMHAVNCKNLIEEWRAHRKCSVDEDMLRLKQHTQLFFICKDQLPLATKTCIFEKKISAVESLFVNDRNVEFA